MDSTQTFPTKKKCRACGAREQANPVTGQRVMVHAPDCLIDGSVDRENGCTMSETLYPGMEHGSYYGGK